METKEMKKCPYCGQEILAVAKKCKHCGNWIDNNKSETSTKNLQETVENRISENKSTKSPKKGGKILWIAAIVIVASIVGIIMLSNSGFDSMYSFHEGLAMVKKNGKYGYIDKSGNVVIPLEFEDAEGFYEGLAAVRIKGKWGFINKNGKVTIPCRYDEVSLFKDGTAPVLFYAKEKSPLDLDSITKPHYGYIDKQGNFTSDIPTKGCAVLEIEKYYQYQIRNNVYSEGLMVDVNNSKKYGFIDIEGNVVIPYKYEDAEKFSEGLAAVKLNGKWGFIDRNDKVVIPFKYAHPPLCDEFYFSEGLVAVGLPDSQDKTSFSRKVGFIDKQGNVVIPFKKYMSVCAFSEGYAEVAEEGGRTFLIDKNGEEAF